MRPALDSHLGGGGQSLKERAALNDDQSVLAAERVLTLVAPFVPVDSDEERGPVRPREGLPNG